MDWIGSDRDLGWGLTGRTPESLVVGGRVGRARGQTEEQGGQTEQNRTDTHTHTTKAGYGTRHQSVERRLGLGGKRGGGGSRGGHTNPPKLGRENERDTHRGGAREDAGRERETPMERVRVRETGRRTDDRQTEQEPEIRAGHWLEETGDGDFRWVAPLSSLDWVPLDPCLSRGFEVTQV